MEITCLAFGFNEPIPEKFTCDGEGVSPPLEFYNVPTGAGSLVIIVHDPDASTGDFTHWIIWNINPSFDGISVGDPPRGSVEGMSDGGVRGYYPPCPPHGERHHYHFSLYALTEPLQIPEEATVDELQEAMEGRVLDFAETIGFYERK